MHDVSVNLVKFPSFDYLWIISCMVPIFMEIEEKKKVKVEIIFNLKKLLFFKS